MRKKKKIKATARCSPIDFSRDIPPAPLGVGLLQKEQQAVGRGQEQPLRWPETLISFICGEGSISMSMSPRLFIHEITCLT